jgi:hypothetical protein
MLKAAGMNNNKSKDLCRMAGELAERAALLRAYRLDFLAKKLESVQQFLDSMNQANGLTQPDTEARPGSGTAVVVFQEFRKKPLSQQSSLQARNIL